MRPVSVVAGVVVDGFMSGLLIQWMPSGRAKWPHADPIWGRHSAPGRLTLSGLRTDYAR